MGARGPHTLMVLRDVAGWLPLENPNLGIHKFEGSTRNNIMPDWPDTHYFNVIKDPHELDPQRRYNAMGEYEGPRTNHTGAAVAFSSDGIH